jgi:hypothetical protein
LGLFERLQHEREEDELRGGRAPGQFYGVDSPALDKLLANATEKRPKNYSADLLKLHRYIYRGVYSPGAGMHFASLKAAYHREYIELKAEAQGQGELLH